jgi:hypothetical protein
MARSIPVIAVGIMLALCPAAVAAPTYLQCTMTNVTWNVALDEANGTVSYTIPEMT